MICSVGLLIGQLQPITGDFDPQLKNGHRLVNQTSSKSLIITIYVQKSCQFSNQLRLPFVQK